ncbi:MAG: response regulator transcription factor [Lachnospiraceae bacterium]|nr:response regulator transcription factor [Lachnospiraceae bacterium]
MIKVMVVEDEEHIRSILKKMIEKNDGFKVVSLCGDFASAISDFIKLRPDVVFMDIDLKGESGLECAKAICEVEPKVKIVFATAHSEYMANAFEIYAFDYLVKPFDMERIGKTLDRIMNFSDIGRHEDTLENTGDEKLLIKGKEEINILDVNDIIMIERTDSTTRIVAKDEVYLTAQSLSSLEEKLNADKFMRCHKSYIIRTDAIKKLEVYGRWTYVVKFKGTDETALMTSAKYDEIKQRFS